MFILWCVCSPVFNLGEEGSGEHTLTMGKTSRHFFLFYFKALENKQGMGGKALQRKPCAPRTADNDEV